jgi:ribosomal protein S18 acetylase RimI-like enzyme
MRRATVRDIDALVSLENACFKSDRESREDFLLFIRSPLAILLIETERDRAVGYALVMCSRFQAPRLFSLCSRKRGFGRKMLAAAERATAERGHRKLSLKVRVDNLRAIDLYERAGYKRRLPDLRNYYVDHSNARRYVKWLTTESAT